MSTLNAILNTSLTGLFTNQSALRVTSNNIANVNTPNYSRVRVEQAPLVLQGQSMGTSVSGITRVVDDFLSSALRTSNSDTAKYSIQSEFHSRLQGLLGKPDSEASLTAQLDDIFASVADLSINPADSLRRQDYITEIDTYLGQISTLQYQIQDLRADVSAKIEDVVDQANELLRVIDNLNPILIRQNVVGGETGGISGQMDQALSELSQLLDIVVRPRSDGGISVFTSSGLPLVDTSLSQLSYSAAGIVNADTKFGAVELHRVDDQLNPTSSAFDLSAVVRSGELRGLLDMRDGQLRDLSLSLGELAAHAADEFNAVHNQFSAIPAPNSLIGKAKPVSANNETGFTGIVNFAVVDATGNVIAKTTVDFDGAPPADYAALIAQVNAGLGGAGTLALNNGVMSLTATDPTHGVAIADDPSAPSDRGGRGFSHYFGMNDIIEASQPGIYETGVASTTLHNLGATDSMTFRVRDAQGRVLTTVTVNATGTTYGDMVAELNNVAGLGAYFNFSLNSNGGLDWTVNPPRTGLELEVLTDNSEIGTTGIGFTEAFGIGDGYQANAARDVKVVDRLQNNQNLLALSQFDLTAAVGQVALTNGDQRGALAFQELESKLVSFDDAGELNATAVTLTQYTARFLGNTGLMANRANNMMEDNMALQTELGVRLSDVTGVNMDEELSNLIVYQNAYNAAARVLSSVQELYDTLLSSV
ncbi:flagellar hook-associated protein FlgK [Gimibacter soli]|uniref:Flagellar hook-associated protein 1 n=1 Tax=Gimibacter soli TaxID=3024400 RepID=A0AAE9XQH4_9PROT|nr:flagellar hook-associated protein FlgK [Gimibacter soli]WCL53241.1 flagellar hook-associated protein FlgK [Gimibacter soli]